MIVSRLLVVVVTTLLAVPVSCTLAHRSALFSRSEKRPTTAYNNSKLSAFGGNEITGFDLIDTRTSTTVATIVNGSVFDLFDFVGTPSFNINASFKGTEIRSVVFGRNKNPDFHTENYAWYSFCGNKGTQFRPCSNLLVGNHTITATPYQKRGGQGHAGAPYTVSFAIVRTGILAPAATSSPVPTTKPTTLQLLDVVALSSTLIDVSSRPSKVELQVTAQDTDMGIYDVSLEVVDTFNMYFTGSNCFYSDLRDKGPVTCNMTLLFPQFIRQGNYTIQISLSSFANQYAFFSTDELTQRSLIKTIEVVNTNEDRQKPKLLNFSLSSTEVIILNSDVAHVEITMVVQDVRSGLSSGRIEAINVDALPMPAYTEAYLDADDFVTSRGNQMTISFILTFHGDNIPSGSYSLMLSLVDRVGNSAIFDATELASRNFQSSIDVVNDNFDGTAPELLNLTVLGSTVVDVTLAPAAVTIQVLFQDNLSGLSQASVSIALEGVVSNEFPDLFSSIRFPEPIATSKPTIVNLTLTIPQYVVPGRYLLGVWWGDAANNEAYLDSSQLQKAAFPYSFDILNSMEDVTPPELLDLSIVTPMPLNGTGVLEMMIVAQDTVSGIVSVYGAIFSVGGGYVEGTVDYDFLLQPIARGRMEFNVTFPISRNTKPGMYSISVTMMDGAGNLIKSSEYTNTDMTSLKLPASFEIINAEYDELAPTLTAVKVRSSTTVDVTTEPGVLEMELFVQDDISGFKNGSVMLRGDQQYGSYFTTITEVAFAAEKGVSGKAVALNVSLPIPKHLKPGFYSIGVELSDFAGNNVQMSLEDVNPFLQAFEIINANEDLEPPTLLNFTALSSLELNVSAGPVVASFEVVVQDDFSGIARWMFSVHFVSTKIQLVKYYETTFDVAIAGEPVTFTVSIPFERGARLGRYEWEVMVADATSQTLTLSSGENMVQPSLPPLITLV